MMIIILYSSRLHKQTADRQTVLPEISYSFMDTSAKWFYDNTTKITHKSDPLYKSQWL